MICVDAGALTGEAPWDGCLMFAISCPQRIVYLGGNPDVEVQETLVSYPSQNLISAK